MKTIKFEGLKEEIYYEKLPCGLEVYLWNDDKKNSFKISLNAKYGSNHTEFSVDGKDYKVPTGIAHYLEHINFNIDDEKTAFDLYEKSGSDINAFTTFDYTSYHVSGTEDIITNINNLLDYVYTPYFKKKLIDRERDIILNEARIGLDRVNDRFYYTKLECCMHNDNSKNRVIGSLDDIKKISLKDINLVYDNFYHPENMFLVVTGKINPFEVLACIKENMGQKKFKKYGNPVIKVKKEPSTVVKEYFEYEDKTDVSQACVTIKISDKKIKKTIKNEIILDIIMRSNFGATSEFSYDLKDNHLITSLGASKSYSNDNFYLKCNVATNYPEEVISRIKNKFKHLELSEESFKRIIRATTANLIFSFEDVENVNYLIQDDIVYTKEGKIVNDIKEILDGLTYKEALEVLGKIDAKNISVVLMKPQKKRLII